MLVRSIANLALLLLLVGGDLSAVAATQHVPGPAPAASEQDTRPDSTLLVERPYEFHHSRTVTRAAEPKYVAGAIRTFFLGKEYRDVWATPVEVPVIDLDRTAGGLTPLRRGGGLQTTSLHLQGGDGHHYVLRSIDKRPGRSLPEGFQNTIVTDIAQDQTSATNPYGAFIVAALAEAAGILHTTPTLVIIPDSPALGEYREEYAGMLALLERKPDEDQSDAPNFGRATNIIGTEKLVEKVREDNDDRVDARAYARSRLFDMLIGDWDRHEDQWRWAEFEGEHGTRFVAVPRDRDFVFVKFNGILLRLARKVGGEHGRKLVDFDDTVDQLYGLNRQAAQLDLRFASALDREDWISTAEDLRDDLSDAEIEAAVRTWPDPVYDRIGAFTIESLKARRDQLPEAAMGYYRLLARVVDIVGTDKHERFEITHLGGGDVEVVMYKKKEEGDVVRELSRRTFHRKDTEEVRLYGLGGDDEFEFRGDAGSGIRIRAIGGEGEDTFVDRSASPRLHFLYDTKTGNEWDIAKSTRVKRSNDPSIHHYEMRHLEQSRIVPTPSLDYDSDDGIFLGGGVRFIEQGFRKMPYAASHAIRAEYAPRSRAVNVAYEGDMVEFWRGWSAGLDADFVTASNFRSFYGIGNETDEADRFRHLARLQQGEATILLYRRISRSAIFGIGPGFTYANVGPLDGSGGSSIGFAPEQLTDTYLAGLRSVFAIDTRDSTIYPRSGIRWESEAGFRAGVGGSDHRFGRVASALSAYYTLRPITFAVRAGGAANIGDFPFFEASTLGGSDNLRGYGTTRFSGHSAVFGNAEARMPLTSFNVYVMAGTLGVIAFADAGRVWAEGERSSLWHTGYGGGLWVAPFDMVLVTSSVGFSPEGKKFDLSFGFFF